MLKFMADSPDLRIQLYKMNNEYSMTSRHGNLGVSFDKNKNRFF